MVAQESALRLRSPDQLLAQVGLALWEYNYPEDRFSWSDSAATLLQCGSDALPRQGAQWLALLHPDDRAQFFVARQQVHQEDLSVETECRIRKPDGQWLWIRLRGACLSRDAQGRVLTAGGSLTELSSQKDTRQLAAAEQVVAGLKAEAERQETRLHSLVHVLPDLIWLKDPQGVYLACNPAFERFFGAPEKEILGKTDYHFVSREQADLFRANDLEALAAKGLHTNEEWITFADTGETILLETTKTPVLDEQGEVIGVLGLGRDITRYYQNARALEETALFLRESQHIARVGGWKANPDTGRLVWTDGIFELLDLPSGACPGLSQGLDYYTPSSRAAIEAALGQSWQSGEPFSLEVEVVSAKGRPFFAELRCIGRMEDAQGPCLAGTLQDISARKEAENLFTLAFQSSPIGMAFTRIRDQMLVDVNQTFCQISGWAREELVGHSATERCLWQEPAARASYLQALQANGRVVSFAMIGRRKDQSTFHCSLSGQLLQRQGETYLLTFAVDVNDRFEAEQKLQVRDEYQRALIDNFPFMVWLKDEEGRFLAVNQLFAEVAGSPDVLSIEGKTDLDFFPRALAEGYQADDRLVLASGQPKHVEEPMETAGQTIWLETYKSPVRLHGRVIGTVGFARDVTARRQTEQVLKETQLRLAQIFDFLPEPTFAIDLQGRVIAWNRAMERLSGTRAEDMLGKGDFEYALPFYGERAPILIDKVLSAEVRLPRRYQTATREDGSLQGESRFTLEDGRLRVLSGIAAPLRNDRGETVGAIEQIQDVTALRLAEEQLVASAAQHHSVFNALNDGLMVFGADGHILSCNPAAERILRHSVTVMQEATVGTSLWSTIYEDGRPCPTSELPVSISLGTGKPQRDVVLGIVFGAADITWLSVNAEPIITLPGGFPDMAVVSFTDITERKHMEDELRASEHRFRSLLQDLPTIAVQAYDSNRRVTFWNKACEIMFGYTREEAEGQLLETLIIPPALRSEVIKLHHQWEAQGIPVPPGELELMHKDGHPVPLFASHSRLLNRQGAYEYYCMDVDLTPLRQAHETLELLNRALEQSANSVIITDLEGRIIYVNSAFGRMSGYSKGEALGRQAGLNRSEHTPPETYQALKAALREGRAWRGEFTNRRKDGQLYTEYAHISPVRQLDGRISHYLSVQEDVTEKKRNAEELNRHRHHLEDLVGQRTAEAVAAKEAAEAASQAKSIFLANMSHEIRTPMNAIIGLTHLLQKENPSTAQAERLSKINASAQHLLSVINDILDVSKIEAGKLVLEHTDFSPRQILDNLATLMTERAETKGLSLETWLDPVLPPYLIGDPLRLEQILLNYCSNGIKFTERGKVRVSVRLETQTPEGLTVRFAVQDTGVGIPAEKQARIFHPFQQADDSTTRRFGGTGLGLVISRRLAELMGGSTGVDSTPGTGSTFWLRVTLSASAYQTQEALPKTVDNLESLLQRQHGGTRLLLVEDNEINQEVAASLLQSAGFVVDVAENGALALDKVAREDYALILMDMQMPVMDGLAATRALRATDRGAHLPIIAMTANAFNDDRTQCLEAGMNDHVAKPVNPDTLFTTLLRWLPSPTQTSVPVPPVDPQASDTSAEGESPLSAVPGLDLGFALAAVRGKQSMLQRMLRLFVDSHRSDIAVIRDALKAGNQAEARRLAHSLKGAAGTLGLTAIQADAARAEACLKAGDTGATLEAALEQLAATLNTSLGDLDQALAKLP